MRSPGDSSSVWRWWSRTRAGYAFGAANQATYFLQATGALPTDKVPGHRKHWLETSGDEPLARAKQLGADYLVLDRTPVHDRIAAQPVYSNNGFAVFATH